MTTSLGFCSSGVASSELWNAFWLSPTAGTGTMMSPWFSRTPSVHSSTSSVRSNPTKPTPFVTVDVQYDWLP